ncbi:MAG: hypothetical protein EXR65_01895 [Dehalococcoidia bacterium]|nr:hypothetical protein [Dehalococcoidia bacterium]
MDGPIDLDIGQVQASLRSLDHALIRITTVGITQRLLVDFRANSLAGPLMQLLPEARSIAERLQSIQTARPQFARPERIHVINWPLRVAALEQLGVLETVRARLASMDAFDALRQLNQCYARLLTLEREEQRRAILGEGYHTLWALSPAKPD